MMYLLYTDDSGLATDKSCKNCVLAGFAIHETQTYWVQRAINEMIRRWIGTTDIELHGTYMRTGKGAWRNIPEPTRQGLFMAVLDYIAQNYPKQFILFGAAINKASYQGHSSLSEELFAQVVSRFDMFLGRKHTRNKEPARGIVIFDKSTSESQFQAWSRMFQEMGNQWGNKLHNFSEVPLFLDSKISRLIQIADIIAYSLFRKYEHGDDKYFSKIQRCFDTDKVAGLTHGLYIR
jgi:hypothetical protein